jgi:hypothetical protein
MDLISLVAGVVFLGAGIAFLTGSVNYTGIDLKFVWPLGILALGFILLVGAGRPQTPSGRTESGTEDDPAQSEGTGI